MPKTVDVIFHKCIQDVQELGVQDTHDKEHLHSRVFFTATIGDKVFPDLTATINQPCGSTDYEDDVLEVGRPEGYSGAWNHHAFADLVQEYYRSLVGSAGSGIRVGPGAQVRMRNNTFVTERKGSFQIPD